jgi:hypothetical protein
MPIPGQKTEQPTEQSKKGADDSDTNKHPPKRITASLIQPDAAQGDKNDSTGQKENQNKVSISAIPPVNVNADVSKDWMDKLTWIGAVLTAIFTGVLVVIGWRGVSAAQKTLKAIEGQLTEMKATGVQTIAIIEHAGKQADAAKTSAEADRLNAQAVINSERPWITVSVSSLNETGTTFVFNATNVGRTPAIVKSIYSIRVPWERGKDLQIPTDDNTNESIFGMPPCFLPPMATCFAGRFDVKAMPRIGPIYFYGRIVYSGTLTEYSREMNFPETKWLYQLPPTDGAMPIPDPFMPGRNTYT